MRPCGFYTHSRYNIGIDEYELYVSFTDQFGKYSILEPVTFRQTESGFMYSDTKPFMVDNTKNFLQAIMDEAWKQGLRPKGFEDHAGTLEATRYHLEDMRLLAKVKK